jgi:hypothetical protein
MLVPFFYDFSKSLPFWQQNPSQLTLIYRPAIANNARTFKSARLRAASWKPAAAAMRGNAHFEPLSMKLFASILAAATLSVFSQQAAFASPEAAYPSKPVKVVVGYAPGGSSDAVARLIAGRLSDKLGQTFVVENRPGAASNIAAATVARSPNDGYTILLGSNASTINVSLYKELSFDFQKDFAPVALLTRFPNIMVVNNTVPAKTVQEFITYQSQPQEHFLRLVRRRLVDPPVG